MYYCTYDSRISNYKDEHSGILVDGITDDELNNIFDEDAPFVMIFKDKFGEVHFGRVRKLTQLKCWRLQGFTDEQFYKVKETGLLYKMTENVQ